MTKFEWERQLKKGISGLPKAEQQRVLDYYNELFADKIDAGLREQYIISEFGNPYDVANKILVDYYNEGKDNPEVDAYIYSSSDEIDEAFDDAPTKTVETPKRKTWTERRDERREAHNEVHSERVNAPYADTVDYDTSKPSDGETGKSGKGVKSASGLIAVLCILVFFVLGACFNLWNRAWLIFLLVPCVISLIEAINRRNWRIFAYPVLVVFLYLLMGFYAHNWHPGWVIFITIPVYYVLGDFIEKHVKGDSKNDKIKKNDTQSGEERIVKEQEKTPREARRAARCERRSSGTASNVISIIAKILLCLCLVWVSVVVWGAVIGAFTGGISLVVSGIASFASAFNSGVNMLTIGWACTQIGLGLILTFGMAALFKPCFNMCKSFVRTIKNSFDNKEKVQ